MATYYDKASLVMIPSGYKDDKLYSIKPTDGSGDFTFSRDDAGASPATRVNASGLIEKGRENVLTYSNTFSNAVWVKTNSSVTSGQSGYDGSSDAWKVDISAGAGKIQQSVSTSGVQTISTYAKAGTINFMRISIDGGNGQYFDLSTGSLGTQLGTIIDAKIESIGSGWYRCSIVASQAITAVPIYPAVADNDLTGTSGNIYIQDAQLESGLVATAPAIETTTAAVSAGLLGDMPRLDYSGGATCPSLLLEPSRVNIITNSEYFNGANWIFGNSSVTDNLETSPEGVINASKIVENTTSNGHTIYMSRSVTLGASYTFSVFAKAGERDKIWIDFFGGANVAVFDLTDGSVLSQSGTGLVADSEDYGNGWYRCYITQNAVDATIYPNFGPTTSSTTNNAYLGDGTSGIFVYGAQLESGSYPTSYIPTYGSASGRALDDCKKTSATDLIGQTEGTFFGEFTFKSTEITNRLFSISGADWNTIGHIRFDIISLRPQAKVRKTGADIAEVIGTEDIAVGSVVKFAVVYTSTTLKAFVNGAQVGSTDTLSGSLPSMDEIVIDALGGGFTAVTQNNQLNPYKQALVFKTALTDAEAIALTTI